MNIGIRMTFLFCLVAGLLANCGKNETGGSETPKDSLKTQEEIENEIRSGIERSCANLKPFQYCALGLDFIKLGDTLTWKVFNIPGAVQKDTVFNETTDAGEFDWNVTFLKFDDGKLILESDFEDDRFLNRVRIETPRYATQKGIRVGMTFGELAGIESDLYIRPLTRFNVVEIITPDKLILHMENKGYFDTTNPPETIAPEKINKDEKIIRIVLMQQM